jgi:hypothetical protein
MVSMTPHARSWRSATVEHAAREKRRHVETETRMSRETIDLGNVCRITAGRGTEEAIERSPALRDGGSHLGNFLALVVESSRRVHLLLLTRDFLLKFLRTLERGVQYDVRVARFALELQQEEVITGNFERGNIHRDALAALRTTHLLMNAHKNLMEGVGVELHHSLV